MWGEFAGHNQTESPLQSLRSNHFADTAIERWTGGSQRNVQRYPKCAHGATGASKVAPEIGTRVAFECGVSRSEQPVVHDCHGVLTRTRVTLARPCVKRAECLFRTHRRFRALRGWNGTGRSGVYRLRKVGAWGWDERMSLSVTAGCRWAERTTHSVTQSARMSHSVSPELAGEPRRARSSPSTSCNTRSR